MAAYAMSVPNIPGAERVLLSTLRPKYDDQMGPLPDRWVTINELRRPAILEFSDEHLGMQNACPETVHEIRENVHGQLVIKKGDIPLTPEELVIGEV